MTPPSDREAFRNLLVEFFAIKTSEELDGLELPSEQQLRKLRSVAAPRADEILRKYERSIVASEVTEAVIGQLRDKLIARSRVANIIEVAINGSLLLLGILVGAWQIFSDPSSNPAQTRIVLGAVFVIVAVQFFGNLYLRYFDRSR